MSSVIILLIILVAGIIFLCYLFNQSKIELNSLTIAAMEAHSKQTPEEAPASQAVAERPARLHRQEKKNEPIESAVQAPAVVTYEYRELLDETEENYVVPQWMVNFFSSSDICHTLDSSDRVVFIVKLADARNAEDTLVDFSAECDMSTQTVSLKFCFGEGAAAETFKTKFYLFERGDLFELNQLVRQQEARIDVLVRSTDYSLEYLRTLYTEMPHSALAQLKNVLSKIPS